MKKVLSLKGKVDGDKMKKGKEEDEEKEEEKKKDTKSD